MVLQQQQNKVRSPYPYTNVAHIIFHEDIIASYLLIGYLAFAGVQIQSLSHETAMVQLVPTPLAVRKGL